MMFNDFDPNAMIHNFVASAEETGDEGKELLDLDDVLKLNSQKEIVIGSDSVDTETLELLVHPGSFQIGFQAWVKNTEGRILDVPKVIKPRQSREVIEKPEPVDSHDDNGNPIKAEFKPYQEVKLLVVNHSKGDLNRLVTISTDSKSGNMMLDDLYGKIVKQSKAAAAGEGPNFICPVVMVGTKFVPKAKKPFTKMELKVVDWADRPAMPADESNPDGARFLSDLRQLEAAKRAESEGRVLAAEVEEAEEDEPEVVEPEPEVKPKRRAAKRAK